MLVTGTATFCGTRPGVFGVRSRSLLRPDRAAEYCSVCKGRSWAWHPARRVVEFRGATHIVCGPCNKRYSDAPGQIARYGFRFRFVERREIPRMGLGVSVPLAVQKGVYKILLIGYERREKRHAGKDACGPTKEVNWMVEDRAEKMLKLPDRIARAMKGTGVLDGDDQTVPEDIALMKIKDLLEEIDPEIFTRTGRKRQRKKAFLS